MKIELDEVVVMDVYDDALGLLASEMQGAATVMRGLWC